MLFLYMVELYTTQQTESCITKKMALRTHQEAGMQSVVAPADKSNTEDESTVGKFQTHFT